VSFQVNTQQLKRVDLVKVQGRVDSSTAPQFEQTLQSLIDSGRSRIVVDLAEAEYLSSAAFRVLISAMKQVKGATRRGDVRIARVPPKLMETFKLGGFDEIFKFYDDDVSAVGSF
jgi:anti-sigma B factor antagonist